MVINVRQDTTLCVTVVATAIIMTTVDLNDDVHTRAWVEEPVLRSEVLSILFTTWHLSGSLANLCGKSKAAKCRCCVVAL
jgi:hypothetical protein